MNKLSNDTKQQGGFLTRLLDSKGNIKQDWMPEHNTGTNQGLAYLQNAGFQRGAVAVTPKSSWYIGIYEGSITTSSLKGSTAATIAADSTEITDASYDETGRILWDVDDAVGNNDDTDRVITNVTTPATFTFSAAKTITGAFICSEQASGGTSATDYLFALSNFTASRDAEIDDVLQVVYDSTLSS